MWRDKSERYPLPPEWEHNWVAEYLGSYQPSYRGEPTIVDLYALWNEACDLTIGSLEGNVEVVLATILEYMRENNMERTSAMAELDFKQAALLLLPLLQPS